MPCGPSGLVGFAVQMRKYQEYTESLHCCLSKLNVHNLVGAWLDVCNNPPIARSYFQPLQINSILRDGRTMFDNSAFQNLKIFSFAL